MKWIEVSKRQSAGCIVRWLGALAQANHLPFMWLKIILLYQRHCCSLLYLLLLLLVFGVLLLMLAVANTRLYYNIIIVMMSTTWSRSHDNDWIIIIIIIIICNLFLLMLLFSCCELSELWGLTLVGKLKKVSWARTVAYCLTLLHVQYVYVRTCLYDTTMVEIARTGPKGPTSKTPFGQSVRSGPVARSRPKTEILVPTPNYINR